MNFLWLKNKVDIKETHGKNNHSVDNANIEQKLTEAAVNLKMNENQLLNALKRQKESLDTLIAICNIIKKKGREKRSINDARGEFINYEEKKKYENFPPIDAESIKTIDWNRLLKELRK